MKKTYHGSCHCGAISFAATLDLSQGTRKCNCRLCWKQRMWKTNRVDIADFTLNAETGAMRGFAGKHQATHNFCGRCGISTHTHVIRPEAGENYVVIQIGSFDDMPIEDLLAAPLTIVDGRHDKWTSTPVEIRHL